MLSIFFSFKSSEEQYREICVAVSLQNEVVALQTGTVWFCASKLSVPMQWPRDSLCQVCLSSLVGPSHLSGTDYLMSQPISWLNSRRM